MKSRTASMAALAFVFASAAGAQNKYFADWPAGTAPPKWASALPKLSFPYLTWT